MDDADRPALRQILGDPALALPVRIQTFIRIWNGDAGPGCPVAWQVSAEEWQRFEFLGDRVINLVAAELLYRNDPPCREGAMTGKMGVVSNESLAAIAERRGIDVAALVPAIIGQQQAYGDAVRGGALEACIGAMFISAGFAATRAVVRELLAGEIGRYDPSTNYIGRLQEHYQQKGMPVPVYELVASGGPRHRPRHTCRVHTPDGHSFDGEGQNSSEAKQNAAGAALRAMNEEKT